MPSTHSKIQSGADDTSYLKGKRKRVDEDVAVVEESTSGIPQHKKRKRHRKLKTQEASQIAQDVPAAEKPKELPQEKVTRKRKRVDEEVAVVEESTSGISQHKRSKRHRKLKTQDTSQIAQDVPAAEKPKALPQEQVTRKRKRADEDVVVVEESTSGISQHKRSKRHRKLKTQEASQIAQDVPAAEKPKELPHKSAGVVKVKRDLGAQVTGIMGCPKVEKPSECSRICKFLKIDNYILSEHERKYIILPDHWTRREVNDYLRQLCNLRKTSFSKGLEYCKTKLEMIDDLSAEEQKHLVRSVISEKRYKPLYEIIRNENLEESALQVLDHMLYMLIVEEKSHHMVRYRLFKDILSKKEFAKTEFGKGVINNLPVNGDEPDYYILNKKLEQYKNYITLYAHDAIGSTNLQGSTKYNPGAIATKDYIHPIARGPVQKKGVISYNIKLKHVIKDGKQGYEKQAVCRKGYEHMLPESKQNIVSVVSKRLIRREKPMQTQRVLILHCSMKPDCPLIAQEPCPAYHAKSINAADETNASARKNKVVVSSTENVPENVENVVLTVSEKEADITDVSSTESVSNNSQSVVVSASDEVDDEYIIDDDAVYSPFSVTSQTPEITEVSSTENVPENVENVVLTVSEKEADITDVSSTESVSNNSQSVVVSASDEIDDEYIIDDDAVYSPFSVTSQTSEITEVSSTEPVPENVENVVSTVSEKEADITDVSSTKPVSNNSQGVVVSAGDEGDDEYIIDGYDVYSPFSVTPHTPDITEVSSTESVGNNSQGVVVSASDEGDDEYIIDDYDVYSPFSVTPHTPDITEVSSTEPVPENVENVVSTVSEKEPDITEVSSTESSKKEYDFPMPDLSQFEFVFSSSIEHDDTIDNEDNNKEKNVPSCMFLFSSPIQNKEKDVQNESCTDDTSQDSISSETSDVTAQDSANELVDESVQDDDRIEETYESPCFEENALTDVAITMSKDRPRSLSLEDNAQDSASIIFATPENSQNKSNEFSIALAENDGRSLPTVFAPSTPITYDEEQDVPEELFVRLYVKFPYKLLSLYEPNELNNYNVIMVQSTPATSPCVSNAVQENESEITDFSSAICEEEIEPLSPVCNNPALPSRVDSTPEPSAVDAAPMFSVWNNPSLPRVYSAPEPSSVVRTPMSTVWNPELFSHPQHLSLSREISSSFSMDSAPEPSAVDAAPIFSVWNNLSLPRVDSAPEPSSVVRTPMSTVWNPELFSHPQHLSLSREISSSFSMDSAPEPSAVDAAPMFSVWNNPSLSRVDSAPEPSAVDAAPMFSVWNNFSLPRVDSAPEPSSVVRTPMSAVCNPELQQSLPFSIASSPYAPTPSPITPMPSEYHRWLMYNRGASQISDDLGSLSSINFDNNMMLEIASAILPDHSRDSQIVRDTAASLKAAVLKNPKITKQMSFTSLFLNKNIANVFRQADQNNPMNNKFASPYRQMACIHHDMYARDGKDYVRSSDIPDYFIKEMEAHDPFVLPQDYCPYKQVTKTAFKETKNTCKKTKTAFPTLYENEIVSEDKINTVSEIEMVI